MLFSCPCCPRQETIWRDLAVTMATRYFGRDTVPVIKTASRMTLHLHQIDHQIRAAFGQNNRKLSELLKQPLRSVAYLLRNRLKKDFPSAQGSVHLLFTRLFVDLFHLLVFHVWGQAEKNRDHPSDHGAMGLRDLKKRRPQSATKLLRHFRWRGMFWENDKPDSPHPSSANPSCGCCYWHNNE